MHSNMRLYAIGILSAAMLLALQCRKLPPQSETFCLGAGRDGAVLLKAFGYGANNRLATTAALKNAVQDMVFKGTPAGNPGCPSRPIVKDIAQRNDAYFKNFFAKNGPYLQFINLTKDSHPERTKVRRWIKVGVDVVVDHRRLREKLIADGKAKGLNDGF